MFMYKLYIHTYICVHTRTSPASYVKAHHTALRDSRDYTAALRHARELGDSLSAALNHTVFPTSAFYVYYEHYLTIVPDVAFSIGVSFGRCPQISEEQPAHDNTIRLSV